MTNLTKLRNELEITETALEATATKQHRAGFSPETSTYETEREIKKLIRYIGQFNLKGETKAKD